VPPERWHLTLKFLGDTSESDAFRLCEAMDRSDLGGAFDLRFAGLGAFPNAGRAKVLWIGCDEGAAALIRLAGVVEKAADHAGFASEATPYRPHLTLSRLRPPQDLRSLVERGSSVEEAESRGRGIAGTMPLMIMRAETVWLYRSHLGHRSVRYERLRSWSLGADAAVERQP
jgi:2'-5' RNA ligase